MSERIEILIKHKEKLIIDLVDFAMEFKKLKPGLSISPEALGNFILLDEMSNTILEQYTKENSFESVDNK